MVVDNTKELFLEDETFNSARENFNVVLQKLFKSMIDSDSEEGSITLKIDVKMTTEFIPNHDPDIQGESRKIHLPSFAHKVTSTITVKEEMKGAQNPNMELIWDETTNSFKLQYISNTDQRTIFDKDAPWNQNNTEEQQGALETDPDKKWMNVQQIEGPVADEGALPGEVADETALSGEVEELEENVVDGDYREVEETDNEEETDESSAEEDDYGYEEPEDEDDGDDEEGE